MKHIFYILLVVLAYGPVRAYAGKTGKTVSYLPVIGMKDQEVRKNGRSVELTMVVDLSGARIRTQHTVSLTPVLVSRDGRREAAFPPVVVDGGTRSKVYLRAQRLKSVELPPAMTGGRRSSSAAGTARSRPTTMRPRCLTSGGCSTDGWSCARRFTDA